VIEEKPEYFSDWGDSRIYSIADIGVGECAGEVVSLFSIEIAKAESQHFDALLALDEGNYALTDERAYQAMLLAARALVRTQLAGVADNPNRIVEEFRTRFDAAELFVGKYAKGKFARFRLDRHETPPQTAGMDEARSTVEEAQLVIEACHA